MTVAQDLNYVEYTGNGVTTIFPFTFKVQDVSQLQVYQYVIATGVATLLDPSLYTVSGTLPGVGSINYAPLGLPMSSLYKVLIYREAALLQNMDIENQGGFLPEVLEIELDRLSMVDQQLQEQLGRSLQVDPGNVPPNITDLLVDIEAGIAAAAISVAARDLAQQYAADAAQVSGVNVPIYASVASASGSTIVAGVKSIRTQFRAPTYAQPATLNGGADFARWSKIDIDAQNGGTGLNLLTYFRSTDRFMPDGTTDLANGGYWVVSSAILDGYMFGAKVDGVTEDTAAYMAALSLGRPCLVPEGNSIVDLLISPTNGVHLYGIPGRSTMTAKPKALLTDPDKGIFYAINKNNIHIHDIIMVAAATVYPSSLHAAITLQNCNDFHIHDISCTGWMDRLVYLAGDPASGTMSRRGKVERVRGSGGQTPPRFSGSAIYITSHTENFTIEDCDFEDGNGGIFIQNLQLVDHYHFRGHRIIGNKIRRMAQYGIICYGASVSKTISGTADNGSGAIRITAVAHELTTEDQILVASVTGTTEANGAWLVDVIDVDTLDLRGSIFANAWISGGTLARYNPSDIEIAGNTVEDIDGTPTIENGMSGNFGAGIYSVGMSALNIHDNVLRRCSLGTTTSSLTPAGIGVSGHIGALSIMNNLIEDCNWRGIYVPTSLNGTAKIENNTIRRCGRNGIYLFDVGKWSVIGNTINGRRGVAASTGILVDATTASQKGVISGNNINTFAATQLLTINKTADITAIGNNVVNDGAASVVCELVKFIGCGKGTIAGNNFDGGLAAFAALTITTCTNLVVSGNSIKMTSDGSLRPAVSMSGVCTGTVFERSNIIDAAASGRMENLSTGGKMHTRDSVNTSGNKTRQIGDTIENVVPVAAGVALWGKSTAGVGGTNWETVNYA